jgi:hypothetical protein
VSALLNAVTAISADDIWAVGSQETVKNLVIVSSRTIVEHFDKTSWSILTSANAPADAGDFNALAGVTALGDGTVVAVGSTSAENSNGTSTQHPLIIRN